MESTESPLEVLSRAATMVQDSSPPDYDCARPCGANKELPSGRWRRERRDKLGGAGYAKQRAAHADRSADAPLDMTTPRGLPPPYSASVGSRSAPKSPSRPSVITCAPRPGSAPAASAGRRRENLSDPVIDEHFRRSLGNDYKSLFLDGDRETANSITVTGLSVDDHFAKALGDTWAKLQKSDSLAQTKQDSGSSPPSPSAAPAAPAAAAAATTPTNNNSNNISNNNNNSKEKTGAKAAAATLLQQRRGLVTI